MHYLKIASIIPKLDGATNPQKMISKEQWPNSERPEDNLRNIFKKETRAPDDLIQRFCDKYDLVITFSKDNEPKVKKNE